MVAEMNGFATSNFAELGDEFRRALSDGSELGGAIAVYKDGEPVVDLWGGFQDSGRSERWDEHTIVCTMSVSKGVTALALLMLVSRQQVDLDAPVADYWPEFAANNKDKITVATLMAHMAALPYVDDVDDDDLVNSGFIGWEAYTKKLAAQAPAWEPGTKLCYHASSYGHLIGEIIRRVSGKLPSDFIDSEICKPLGIQFLMGASDAEIKAHDVSPLTFPPEGMGLGKALDMELLEKSSNIAGPNFIAPGDPDFATYEYPAGSGATNARSLAKMFSVLAMDGEVSNVRPLSPALIERAATEHPHSGWCVMCNVPMRVGLGFLISNDFAYFGPNPENFGSAGAGGANVFVDRSQQLSFAYTPSLGTSETGTGPKSRRLVDALWRCLQVSE